MAFLRQAHERVSSFSPKDPDLCRDGTEEKIIQRINWGDQAALETIFHEHYNGLCRFISYLTKSRDDVEDMVQDIFVRIWLNRESWRPKGSIKAYLFRAARNQAFNFLKARQSKDVSNVECDDLVLSDPSTDPVEEMIDRDISALIRGSIQKLPQKCRLVFTLNRQEGLSYSEIAEVLDISVKTVENQIAHALKTLRKELKDLI